MTHTPMVETETICIHGVRVMARLEAIEDVIVECRTDVRGLRTDVLAELGRIHDAQEQERADRVATRTGLLTLAQDVASGMLTPGVVMPLAVVAVVAMALAWGASLTYGDLVVEAAAAALDSDEPVDCDEP